MDIGTISSKLNGNLTRIWHIQNHNHTLVIKRRNKAFRIAAFPKICRKRWPLSYLNRTK